MASPRYDYNSRHWIVSMRENTLWMEENMILIKSELQS